MTHIQTKLGPISRRGVLFYLDLDRVPSSRAARAAAYVVAASLCQAFHKELTSAIERGETFDVRVVEGSIVRVEIDVGTKVREAKVLSVFQRAIAKVR